MDDELRVFDERWRPIVEQVRRQLNAKGLPRPAGMEHERGSSSGYALQRTRLANGRVSCYLYFYRHDRSCVHIGSFVVDAERWQGKAPAPRKRRRSPGMPMAGKVISLACGRSVRVEVDEMGLPYPVPVLPAGPSANAGAHEYSNAERKAEEWGEQSF